VRTALNPLDMVSRWKPNRTSGRSDRRVRFRCLWKEGLESGLAGSSMNIEHDHMHEVNRTLKHSPVSHSRNCYALHDEGALL
jgi:hypothetical protein